MMMVIVIVMFHMLISTTTTTTTKVLVGVEGFRSCGSQDCGWWTTTCHDITTPTTTLPRRSQRQISGVIRATQPRSQDHQHHDENDSDRVSHILYLGHLDWTVTTTEWERRIRHLLSWNVTLWNANDDDTRNAAVVTSMNLSLNLTFRPSTLRPRDVGKYHGGSVLLTFYDDSDRSSRSNGINGNGINSNPTSHDTLGTNCNNHHHDRATRAAVAARQHLLQQQQQQDPEPAHWITPLRIQYHFVPPPLLVPNEPSTDELQELQWKRLNRTASYTRRRIRLAETTDQILLKLEQQQQQQQLVDQSGWWTATTTTTGRTILVAPVLDWTRIPSILDPALGGGLILFQEEEERAESSSLPFSTTNHPHSNRATRKRAAVEAFQCVVRHVLSPTTPSDNDDHPTTITIADLCCGAGNLALPLAWWLNAPQCHNAMRHSFDYRVLGIDLNTISLRRLLDRARQYMNSAMTEPQLLVETLEMDLLELIDNNNNSNKYHTNNEHLSKFQKCRAVVSLHACGAASDLAIMAAIQHQLPFVISPCCIGKILTVRSAYGWDAQNNSAFLSHRRQNVPLTMPTQRASTPMGIITYPRSKWFQQHEVSYDQFRLIAAAADYGVRQKKPLRSPTDTNDTEEMRRYQRQRRAKRLIEIDRLQYAYEQGYEVRLLELPRIGPLYTKRELLIGALRNTPAAEKIATLPVCFENFEIESIDHNS